MKQILNRIYSYLPSQKGKESLNTLGYVLSVRGGISFDIKKVHDENKEYYFAESNNIHNKSIVVTGNDLGELDKNIKDAIFALYEVPAYYAKRELIKSPNILAKENIASLQYAS